MKLEKKREFVKSIATRLIRGVRICHAMGIPMPYDAAERLERDIHLGKIAVIEQGEAKNLGVSREGVTAGYWTKKGNKEYIVLPSMDVTDPLTIAHEFGHALRDRAYQLAPLHFQEQYDNKARALDEKYNNGMVELAMLATGWSHDAVRHFDDMQVFKGREAISGLMNELEKKGKKDIARNVDGLITKSVKARPILTHKFVDGVVDHIQKDYYNDTSPHYRPDATDIVEGILRGKLKFEPSDMKELKGRLVVGHTIIGHLFGAGAEPVKGLGEEERAAVRVAAFRRLVEKHDQLKGKRLEKAIDTLHRDPKTREVAETFRLMKERRIKPGFIEGYKKGREKMERDKERMEKFRKPMW